MGKREEIEDLQARVDVLVMGTKRHEAYLLRLQERVIALENAGVGVEREPVVLVGDARVPEPVAKTKGMNFVEACKLMREGKKVARATMIKGEFFVTNKIGTICYTLRDGQLMASIGFCLETVLATDWELYEDGK